MELSKSIEPVRSEIFKLYYSEPATVKSQIEDVLSNMDATAAAGEGSAVSSSGAILIDRVKITVDTRLRALIVLGGKDDLDFIEKLVNEIDIPTKQILIEAFVVTVTDSLRRILVLGLGCIMVQTKQISQVVVNLVLEELLVDLQQQQLVLRHLEQLVRSQQELWQKIQFPLQQEAMV